MSHVILPYGFVINLCLKNYSRSEVLREALIGHFGKDDEQIILITPVKHKYKIPSLIVEACLLWGKDGVIGKKGDRIFGDFEDGKHIEIYSSGKKFILPYTYSLSPYFAIDLSEPVCFSTFPCSAEEARILIDKVRADTIYECEKDRICSPVSRIWNKAWGGYVLFDWDTFFAALMASVDNKELAYLNALAILGEVTMKGFVPNFAANNDIKSRDRSQPPVSSMVAMEIYKKYKEKWFLDEIYQNLYLWNGWFAENRTTDEGYMCWGSNKYEPTAGSHFEYNHTGDLQGAAFESGLDNSHRDVQNRWQRRKHSRSPTATRQG